MKKSLNFLLILSIVCLIVTLVLNYCAITFNDFGFQLTKQVANNVSEMNGNPGTGEYLIIFGTLGLLADLAIIFVILILLLVVPFFTCVTVIIFQIIARLFQIGEEKKWKDIVSKVFTVLSIIVETIGCIVLICILISNLEVSKFLLFVSLVANIMVLVLFIREFIEMNKLKQIPNTYSNNQIMQST